jgi:YgiT-type zinc finger domain-containing protein
MQHQTWDDLVTYQGKSVTVHAVSGHRCSECGEGVFDDESYDRVVAAGDGLIHGRVLFIIAEWDDEANVWVATANDVPGLVTEAETMEELSAKLNSMVPELLVANSYPDGGLAMKILPIKTKEDYKAALREASAFFDNEPAPGSTEGDRFEALIRLIEAYETKALDR